MTTNKFKLIAFSKKFHRKKLSERKREKTPIFFVCLKVGCVLLQEQMLCVIYHTRNYALMRNEMKMKHQMHIFLSFPAVSMMVTTARISTKSEKARERERELQNGVSNDED